MRSPVVSIGPAATWLATPSGTRLTGSSAIRGCQLRRPTSWRWSRCWPGKHAGTRRIRSRGHGICGSRPGWPLPRACLWPKSLTRLPWKCTGRCALRMRRQSCRCCRPTCRASTMRYWVGWCAWRRWHPIDPTRPDAALRELPGIGPGTVVWLNEAQFYLDPAEAGLGERVAAGLRALLRDPDRAPVLVLATLWPQFWDGLTTRPEGGADPHAQARELLAGHDITVPPAFTALQLQRLSQAGDARLAQAATGAQDGQVIQFLAGAPELLARYRNAPPAAAALISAAMDARRLGTGIGLPQAFLAAAAPGYLTDTEWDALGEDWLEQALAYIAVPCKGVRGPLTPIRSRPARSRP